MPPVASLVNDVDTTFPCGASEHDGGSAAPAIWAVGTWAFGVDRRP